MYPNMMMAFAEEPNAPAEPQAEPKPAEPKEPEPAEPPAQEPESDTQKKISALQASLDSALEQLSQNPEPKPTEPEPEPAEPKPAEPAPKPAEPKPAEPAHKPEPKGDAAWEQMRKEMDEFKSTTSKRLEDMQLKDEMIAITQEVSSAITKFPNADADQILYEIESGSEESVDKIAERLHNQHLSLIENIRKEQEEKIIKIEL